MSIAGNERTAIKLYGWIRLSLRPVTPAHRRARVASAYILYYIDIFQRAHHITTLRLVRTSVAIATRLYDTTIRRVLNVSSIIGPLPSTRRMSQ